MLTLFHGSHRGAFTPHAGLCLCEEASTARAYAGPDGAVFRVDVDEDLLSWERVEGYDRDTDTAPADRDPAALAAEVDACSVWYRDEDPRGRSHDTLRLLTTEALAAIVRAELLAGDAS